MKPKPAAAPDQQQQAEEQVQDQGILAFRDKLESIKETRSSRASVRRRRSMRMTPRRDPIARC